MSLEGTIKEALPADVADELLEVVGRVRSNLERSAIDLIDRAVGEPHTPPVWALAMSHPEIPPTLVYSVALACGREVNGAIPVELVTEPEPALPAWSVAVGE